MQNSCFTGEKQGSKDILLKKDMLWNDKAEVKKRAIRREKGKEERRDGRRDERKQRNDERREKRGWKLNKGNCFSFSPVRQHII